MLFFKRRKKPVLPEPDPTRVRLYNGDYYACPSGNTTPPYVCTLLEWAEDSDVDFPAFAMECALAILDEYPVVVNCLRPICPDDTFLREDDDAMACARGSPFGDFGWRSSVVTMTNGPDRNLIATQDVTDESVLFTFYAYHDLPADDTLPGQPFVPDVEMCFRHLHTRLTIKSIHGVEVYADKIRAVCEKHGRTLVMEEFRC